MLFHSILFNTLANSTCKENSTEVMLVGDRASAREKVGAPIFRNPVGNLCTTNAVTLVQIISIYIHRVPLLHGCDPKFYINMLII